MVKLCLKDTSFCIVLFEASLIRVLSGYLKVVEPFLSDCSTTYLLDISVFLSEKYK